MICVSCGRGLVWDGWNSNEMQLGQDHNSEQLVTRTRTNEQGNYFSVVDQLVGWLHVGDTADHEAKPFGEQLRFAA